MTNFKICTITICLTLVSVLQGSASAEIITFNVNVAQDSVTLGESVDWQIFATVSESTPLNFGIASIVVRLSDSTQDELSPGSIGSLFNGYVTSGGTWEESSKSLISIGGTMFVQNISTVQGANPTHDTSPNLGPLLLVSGSYTPVTLGSHSLTPSVSGITPISFFTASNQFLAAGNQSFATVFNADTFAVTAAVPEPSSVLFLTVTTMLCGGIRYRSRRKLNA